MKKTSAPVYVLSIVIGLVAMCLCSMVVSPEWSAFTEYLVFLCMASVIVSTAAKDYDSPRAKTFSHCVILGLIGIAVMQLCGLLLSAAFSGFAAFIVFLVFAGVILSILRKQQAALEIEYQTAEEQDHDLASFIISTLREKGITDDEIRHTLVDRYGIDAQTVETLMSAD